MTDQIVTQELLHRLFNYDPETGILTNRINRGAGARAGKEAGCVHKLKKCGKSYKNVGIYGKVLLVHRVIWLYVKGEWPDKVDHEDGNGLNNRLSNLRSVEEVDNSRNRRLVANNKSGQLGVCWNKRQLKWRAYIKVNSRQIHVGTFSDLQDAVAARKAAESQYGFHENHGQIRPL